MPTTQRTLSYATPGGEPLLADVYLPAAVTAAPVVVCMHGGAWKAGSRASYRFLGPYLAEAGYVAMSIDYRLVKAAKNRYPAAVEDVRAAVAYVREHAAELNADVERIALMGDSAGGHLAALVGLQDSATIKAFVGVFGVYDLAAQWQYDLASRPNDNIAHVFLGTSLIDDRQLYFDASPISYATTANNRVAALLAWGTSDDVVPAEQSENFLRALKQAGFYARPCVQAAPHFWVSDPLDEPGSYSGFFAVRLLRFLNEKLAP